MDTIIEMIRGYLSRFQLTGPLYSSLIIMAIIIVLAIIVGIQARRQDPTKPSKGLLFLAEWGVEKIQNWTVSTMGDGFDSFSGYFLALVTYLFVAFIWGITGLPSVMDYIALPLVLSFVMFFLIHKTAIKYQHWGYFKRYIDPIPVFLPINLISMWAPVISTTLRMFGNALSGYVIISLVTWALGNVSNMIVASPLNVLAPIPVGVLNLYFSLFSGYIQTLVFASLSAIWISQERPDELMGVGSQAIRQGE